MEINFEDGLNAYNAMLHDIKRRIVREIISDMEAYRYWALLEFDRKMSNISFYHLSANVSFVRSLRIFSMRDCELMESIVERFVCRVREQKLKTMNTF